jgi:hypothetical protein
MINYLRVENNKVVQSATVSASDLLDSDGNEIPLPYSGIPEDVALVWNPLANTWTSEEIKRGMELASQHS